jgi:hypothetical protein
MVNVLSIQPQQISDTWLIATWEDFLVASGNAETDKIRGYYDSGLMRIETMGVGSGHSQDNTLIAQVVSLYGIIKNLRVKGFTNGSFRRTGEQECQPDMAFYLGEDIPNPFPPKNTELVDVDLYGPPYSCHRSVLRGLEMNTIEEALRRNQTEDDTEVSHWLMQEFGTIELGI